MSLRKETWDQTIAKYEDLFIRLEAKYGIPVREWNRYILDLEKCVERLTRKSCRARNAVSAEKYPERANAQKTAGVRNIHPEEVVVSDRRGKQWNGNIPQYPGTAPVPQYSGAASSSKTTLNDGVTFPQALHESHTAQLQENLFKRHP